MAIEFVEFYIKLVTAILFVVLVAAWSIFSRERKGRLPPGPFPLPIIGNLHMLGKLPHRALAALSMKYGPLMSIRLGSTLTLVVSSPEMATEFLKTRDQIFASRAPSAATKHLTYNMSDVIFSPYGPYWRQMRRLCVSQLLNPKRLDYFRFIREEEVSAMIQVIVNSDDSRPLNISQTVSSLATAIICRMAFSRKYSDQDLRDFSSMVKESFLLFGTFNIADYIPYLHWMDLQGLNRRLRNNHKAQDYFLEKVIDEHVAHNDPNVPKDLVDVLLAEAADKDAEFQLSRDNIKAVLFDMLLGGSDTAPPIIEWAMSEVLKNPLVLTKLQHELEHVVGFGRIVCETDLPRLVYLQAVVKETLRLYPQGAFLFRHLSSEPCNVLGYEIPQNTRVLVNVWAIGRNPESWEDAGSFKPERFMEEVDSEVDANGDQNLGWLSFGAGRRRCPGQQLGTLMAEFAVAQLLHCFNWRVPLADMNEQNQELDMIERFNGITLPRAHQLFAITTPRLECIAHLK
uniref:Cytochrome P450 CYP736B6 n=1 Tax=Picea glauca TaxID=3330 RepID=A0A0G7ZP13_PICGL